MQTEFGAGTFTMSYILFLLTGYGVVIRSLFRFCCCWIPYCMPDCQDKVHKCSNCHEEVGIKPYNIC